MMRIKKHDFYVDRSLEPHEEQAGGFHAKLHKKLLKDKRIENETYRGKLKENEGDISIIVEAGEELGQVRIAVQYEGEKGQNDKCLSRQGELIKGVSAWLEEIYSQFQGDFEMEMVSQLCPRGDTRLLLNQVKPQVAYGSALKQEVRAKSSAKTGR